MTYHRRVRGLVPFLTVLILALSSPSDAQTNGGVLARLKSIDPKTLTGADCSSQIAKASSSNGPELIYGGAVCNAVGRPEDSSFLMIAGQIRATADVLLLPPATQADDQSLMDLYGMLWAGGGVGGVKDEVLRDPSARERFLRAFENWRPAYSPSYHPGWTARRRPDTAKYEATVAVGKAEARQYFDRVVRLVSDDQYYSLHREYMQLLEQNRDGIQADTPEGKRLDELQNRMIKRMLALGVDPGPSPSELAAEAEKGRRRPPEDSPPLSPAKDEHVLAKLDNDIVLHCVDLAERSAVSQGGKIVRVLITSSPKWGPIWRADIEGGDQPPTRFACTETTSSSSPLQLGDIPPLPSSNAQP